MLEEYFGSSSTLQRNERVKLSCHARSVSAQLNLVGANLRPDAAAAPHGRTSGVDRGNPPTRRTPGIDKNARLRLWADRPRDANVLPARKLNDRAVLFSHLVPPIREPPAECLT